MDRRDPVEVASDGTHDLYDIATWEPRTWLDRLSVRLHRGLVRAGRAAVILVAVIVLVAQFALTGLAAIINPSIGAFILLSVLPAFAIAAYVWRIDVTMREPLGMLVTTFILGILLAGFAAILNTLAQPAFRLIPVIGVALFFYLIVAPVEETVKWLAVRLYAYRSPQFHAVVDGAVYGAVAGLGFATIENTLYIGQQYLVAAESGAGPLAAAFQTAAVRTFAGPGHVIYSGFAGYYLGLAKFNRQNAGPIVVKGLLIAALLHGTYNTVVTYLPSAISFSGVRLPAAITFLGFVVVYDGIFGYALYRKMAKYRRAYRDQSAGGDGRSDQVDDQPEEEDEPSDAENDPVEPSGEREDEEFAGGGSGS